MPRVDQEDEGPERQCETKRSGQHSDSRVNELSPILVLDVLKNYSLREWIESLELPKAGEGSYARLLGLRRPQLN